MRRSSAGVGGVVMAGHSLLTYNAASIAALAAKQHIPSIGPLSLPGELEFGRLLDRDVARLGALQDLIDEIRRRGEKWREKPPRSPSARGVPSISRRRRRSA